MRCMTVEEQTLPSDAESLKVMVMALAASHTTLEEAKEAMRAEFESEIALLREHIRLLVHKRFGPSSEKISREQLRLLFEADALQDIEEAETSEPSVTIKEHSRRKRGRRPLPAALPRFDVIHDLSDEERICPNDGELLKRIGEVTSEQLSYIPATMRVLRHVRYKYACPLCEDGSRSHPWRLSRSPRVWRRRACWRMWRSRNLPIRCPSTGSRRCSSALGSIYHVRRSRTG